jgi:membrane protein required for colicin V production
MVIDILFAVVLIYSIFKGISNGLIVGIFSTVAWIIGLAAAVKLSSVVTGYLESSFDTNKGWIPFVAFFIVFIGVVLLVRLGAALISKAVNATPLGLFNRLGGVVFYLFSNLVILSIILFYLDKLNIIKPATVQESRTYSWLQPLGPWVIGSLGEIIPFFKGMFAELSEFFERVSGKTPKTNG